MKKALMVSTMIIGVLGGVARTAAQQPDPRLLERARRLLAEVPIVDGHNDLPSKVLELAGGDPDLIDVSKAQPRLHTDLARLRSGGVGAQFWSAYVENDSIRTGGSLRVGLREVDMALR